MVIFVLDFSRAPSMVPRAPLTSSSSPLSTTPDDDDDDAMTAAPMPPAAHPSPLAYASLPAAAKATARELVASMGARLILSGYDGVTARDIAHALDASTSHAMRERVRDAFGKFAQGGARSDVRGVTLSEAFVEDAMRACSSDWITRADTSSTTTMTTMTTTTMNGDGAYVYDLPGREFRPPKTWLGARNGESARARVRKPHASVRDVLRMCRGSGGAQRAAAPAGAAGTAGTGAAGAAGVGASLVTIGVGADDKGAAKEAISPPRKREAVVTNPLMKAVVAAKAEAKKSGKKGAKGAAAAAAAAAAAGKDGKKAKRKIDKANEKAGNHLSLVHWVGQGVVDKVRPDRTYYTGFTCNEDTFKKGDAVYCLPEKTNEDMYLAQLESMFEDEEGKWIECCWFMTQKEVQQFGGKLPADTVEHELFLGTSVDVNAIASLEGIAPVYTHEKFIQEVERAKARRASASDASDANAQASSEPPPAKKKKSSSSPSTNNANDDDDSAGASTSTASEKRFFARKIFIPNKGGSFHPLQWTPERGFWVDWSALRKKKKTTAKKSKSTKRRAGA